MEKIENIIKEELENPLTLDREYSEESDCKMNIQGKHQKRKFQRSLIDFAEKLIYGVFLVLDVASSPLPEDENTASLQRAFHSHLNYTKLRLGIYKPIGEQSSSESSSENESSENESDEQPERGRKYMRCIYVREKRMS